MQTNEGLNLILVTKDIKSFIKAIQNPRKLFNALKRMFQGKFFKEGELSEIVSAMNLMAMLVFFYYEGLPHWDKMQIASTNNDIGSLFLYGSLGIIGVTVVGGFLATFSQFLENNRRSLVRAVKDSDVFMDGNDHKLKILTLAISSFSKFSLLSNGMCIGFMLYVQQQPFIFLILFNFIPTAFIMKNAGHLENALKKPGIMTQQEFLETLSKLSYIMRCVAWIASKSKPFSKEEIFACCNIQVANAQTQTETLIKSNENDNMSNENIYKKLQGNPISIEEIKAVFTKNLTKEASKDPLEMPFLGEKIDDEENTPHNKMK